MAAAAYFYPVEALNETERESLILEHLPQVRLIARKLHERLPDTVMLEDLFSAGVIGLINAVDNFDPRQNVKLRTYAEFRIRGAILDSLRESDWAPRLKRRLARDLEAGVAQAEQRLGRTAEESEIATQLNITVEDYRQKLNEVSALEIGELEFSGDGNELSSPLHFISTPDEASPAVILERAELERLIASSIDGFPKVEKTILSLYFYEELTLREIGEIMDLHFSRVSQIKTQAILRLRNAIGRQWPGLPVREQSSK